MSGAFKEIELTAPLSRKISLFDVVPLPAIIMLPVAVIVEPVMLSVVLITVLPAITEAPLIVAPEIIGLVKDLLVSVAAPVAVKIVPESGNIAELAKPVPPRLVGRMPVTAACWLKLMEPNDGMPPPLGTTRVWNGKPAAVESKLPSALPNITPLTVKLAAPVPPLATPITPDVI